MQKLHKSDVDTKELQRPDGIYSRSLSSCNSIKTFDFSTLCTAIPPVLLKSRLKYLINNCLLKKNGERRYTYIFVGRTKTVCSTEHKVKKIYRGGNYINVILPNWQHLCSVGGRVFKQTIDIPMGTNSSSLLADVFNSSTQNELNIKDTTDTFKSSSYLDLQLQSDNGEGFYKLCDKRDNFKFPIVNFPFIGKNIPAIRRMAYTSPSSSFSRACIQYSDFLDSAESLTQKLLRQGYPCLKSALKNFYGRHHNLVVHRWRRIFSCEVAE